MAEAATGYTRALARHRVGIRIFIVALSLVTAMLVIGALVFSGGIRWWIVLILAASLLNVVNAWGQTASATSRVAKYDPTSEPT